MGYASSPKGMMNGWNDIYGVQMEVWFVMGAMGSSHCDLWGRSDIGDGITQPPQCPMHSRWWDTRPVVVGRRGQQMDDDKS